MTEKMVKRYKTSLFGLVLRRLLNFTSWRKPIHTLRVGSNQKHLKRSIFIRAVDGGSSNGEELEIANLFNPVYDLSQYGFSLTASPHHADLLLISGPITIGMLSSLVDAFRAMPEPRRVITLGDAWGPESIFASSYAVVALPSEIQAACVAHIPGNPPSPSQMIEVLINLDFS
jgi:Ni,Fe-hydrogenase III small subunit